MLLAFAAARRFAEWTALATMPPGLGVGIAIASALKQSDQSITYVLGGWAPPLGEALRADGLAVVMIVITAVVICGVGVFGHAEFRTPDGVDEARAPFAFWILLLAIWA